MKVRHFWTVLCERSLIDSSTNNISLINAIEQLNVALVDPTGGLAGPGAAAFQCSLVSLWGRQDLEIPTKAVVKFEIRDPEGVLLHESERDLDLTEKRRIRFRNNFNAFPVTVSGVYEFLVFLQVDDANWEQVASVPVEVLVRTVSSDEKAQKAVETVE